MRGAVERGHLVLGLGDFNMLPLSFGHQLITAHAPVQDAWRVLHPESSIGPADNEFERARGRGIPNALYNLTENGATCDGVLNTWRWGKKQQRRLFKGENIIVYGTTRDVRAKRLDYIFVGNGATASSISPGWRVQDIKVGMTERHPSIGCSLSDHFSVEATLSRTLDIQPQPVVDNETESRGDPSQHNIPFLPVSKYDAILSMIDTYTLRERRQRRIRLSNFGLSIVVAFGCFAAVWWSPRPFVAFLLMVLSTLGFGAGVLDGLIGGFFIGSELRALKEFEWEIRNAKAIAEKMCRWDSKLEKQESRANQGGRLHFSPNT